MYTSTLRQWIFARDLSEGDVVVLKSGSPPMTVDIKYKDACKCAWYDKETNSMKYSVISINALEYQNNS